MFRQKHAHHDQRHAPAITDQHHRDAVMARYACGEIGINKVAELLDIHIMDAYALLTDYNLEIQLTVDDFQQEMDAWRRDGTFR